MKSCIFLFTVYFALRQRTSHKNDVYTLRLTAWGVYQPSPNLPLYTC